MRGSLVNVGCRRSICWLACRATVAALCFWLLPQSGRAGTTGKIAGTVLDAAKRPVVAATVAVTGSPFGAFTNDKGQYNILNVPAGTYEVKISRIGFKALVIRDAVVSADQTTRLDANLEEAAMTMETVVVKATRPPVDVNLTSSMATLQSEEIAKLPVQELQDVVNLQAGVVDGHFRGGRLGEVQYQLDGVSMNNAFDNSAGLKVDRSLLQEVQVISGTFDAEFGQAMSGVVNAVLKDGTPRWQADVEFYGGGFFFPGREEERLGMEEKDWPPVTLGLDEVQPTAVGNATVTLSGPLGLPQTVFLANVRRYAFDDYVTAQRLVLPVPTLVVEADSVTRYLVPTAGDGAETALGYSREWAGAFKISNSSVQDWKLSYSFVFNDIEARRTDYVYRANPDGMATQETFSLAHGLDLTHTFGKSSYLDVSLRQNYFDYFDRAYEDLYDSHYDAAGPPTQLAGLQDVVVWGVDFTRYQQTTNTFLLKSSIVSQLSQVQQLKGGIDLQWPEVQFGNPGHLVYTQGPTGLGQVLNRYVDMPPDYPGVQTYWPFFAAAYVQDQLEWRDLTLRLGLRGDVFDANSSLPSDLANPANAIASAPASVPVPTSAKAFLSPRLGVAYPITESAGIHFAYGHFVQFPTIRDIFTNADYSVLARLQASTSSYARVMGNPDIDPEKSVQYEFGYKQALSENFGYEVNLFYKDVRDLLGTEFIDTYNDATYARLTNVDFGTISGITVALDHRRLGPVSLAMDYTWQRAQGNSSDPYETAQRAEAGDDPRPRVIPFDWDQRHTFNMTLALGKPDVYSASLVLRAGSGQPYTPETEQGGFGYGLAENSGNRPFGALVDLRGDRSFGWLGQRWSVFGRVFNLLDTRYFNGGVYASTGSPYYSRFPDQVTYSSPTHFYGPRRIELGLTLRTGG